MNNKLYKLGLSALALALVFALFCGMFCGCTTTSSVEESIDTSVVEVESVVEEPVFAGDMDGEPIIEEPVVEEPVVEEPVVEEPVVEEEPEPVVEEEPVAEPDAIIYVVYSGALSVISDEYMVEYDVRISNPELAIKAGFVKGNSVEKYDEAVNNITGIALCDVLGDAMDEYVPDYNIAIRSIAGFPSKMSKLQDVDVIVAFESDEAVTILKKFADE